jgi:DNA-binding NarL/FixJ family response regulator
MMREVLRTRLKSVDVEVIAEASNGNNTLDLICELRPDIAIIDVRMPGIDGFAVLEALSERSIPTRSLVLSACSDPSLIKRALDKGASGFMCKASNQDVFARAVESILAGQSFVDPTLAADLMNPQSRSLSPRELEVLGHVSEGRSNKAIALDLSVSQETIKAHISSIMTKLDVTSRSGAVARALRSGLVA